MLYNDTDASDDLDKVYLLNQFFNASNITLPSDADTLDPSVKYHLISIAISEADVFNVLTSLNTTKAVGIDDIWPMILKHCMFSIFIHTSIYIIYFL